MSKLLEMAIAIKGKLDGSLPASFKTATTNAQTLTNQIRSMSKSLKDAQRIQANHVKTFNREDVALGEKILKLQNDINAASKRRSQILDSQRAKAEASAKLSQAQSQFGTAAMAVGAASAPLIGAVSVAANFEQAMSKVQAITRSSNEDLEKLTATAQKLGATTKFSATEAAEAMSYLGMAGWKAEQIMAGMPGLLDLAAASGSSLATVADIISDDLTAFGMSADQAGHMADVFAAASSNANTNVEMMGQTFKYVAPVAGSLGYTLEDVAVATGLLANAGIKADQAGTSLRAIMARLAAPTKESGTAMDRLGISITNADGTMKPFMQTMQEMRAAFAGLGEAEQAELAKNLAGQEAMSGLLAIMNASESDFANLTNSINNADGAAAQMAQTMNANAKGSIIQLQSALESVAIAVGTAFLPALTDIAQKAAELAGTFGEWAKEHQTLIITITAIGAALATAVLGILAFNMAVAQWQMFVATITTMQTAITGLGIASKITAAYTTVLNAVMALNPFVLVAMAVIALIGALVYLWNTNEGFREAVINAWNAIKETAISAFTAVKDFLVNAFNAVSAFIMSIPQNVAYAIGFIAGYATQLPAIIGNAVIAAAQFLFKLPFYIRDMEIQFALFLLSWLQETYTTVTAWISKTVASAYEFLMELPGKCAAAGSQFVEAARQWASDAYNAVMDWINKLPGAISDAIGSAWEGIKAKFSAGFNIGVSAAQNAEGGIYGQGAFLTTFAEKSPEAAIPINGSKRALGLWEQTGAMLGVKPSSGSNTITFAPNITVNGGGPDTQMQISALLDQKMREFEAMMRQFQSRQRRLSYE